MTVAQPGPGGEAVAPEADGQGPAAGVNRPTNKFDYREEENIPANEQPGPRGAITVPAATAQPGAVASLNRKVNFPRDPNDDMDVLKLQIFLDYHGYSPGEIDGQWATTPSVRFFVYQKNNGLESTGQLDDRITARLDAFKDGFLVEYPLTSSDLETPIGTLPRDYYAMAKMK